MQEGLVSLARPFTDSARLQTGGLESVKDLAQETRNLVNQSFSRRMF